MADNKQLRNLYLFGIINTDKVKPIIESIHRINKEDDDGEKNVVNYNRYKKPITIHINSIGGSVPDGLALISAIELSKTPIHTEGIGEIASMGLFIFVAGHKRFAHKFSSFMYHDMSYGINGTIEDHRRLTGDLGWYKEICTSYLLDRTNITKEKLEEYDRQVRDWYIRGDDVFKYGIADEKLDLKRLSEKEVKEGNFVVE